MLGQVNLCIRGQLGLHSEIQAIEGNIVRPWLNHPPQGEENHEANKPSFLTFLLLQELEK